MTGDRAQQSLAAIRDAERAAARNIAAAQSAAEDELRAERGRVSQLIAEARERGRRTADQRYTAAIAAAKLTARSVRRDARQRAAELTAQAAPWIRPTVARMLDLILPADADGGG